MPWSDWQEGPIHTVNWTKVGTAYRARGNNFNGDWNMGDASTVTQQIYGASLEDGTSTYPYGSVLNESQGMFLRLNPGWKQVRDGIPFALSSLEYGKDWDQIPGRPGEFVEYETTADNTPLSTRGPNLLFKAGVRGGGVETGGSREGDGAWSLGVVTGAVAPPPYSGSGTNEQPDSAWPGLGTVFATGDPNTPINTNYRSAFPDITGAEHAFVSARMTGAPPLNGEASSAWFTMLDPMQLTYQLPRWRYWIPGTPPLRLRQRDDDLFFNTGRLRQRSSRQSTNRLRAYD